MLAKFFKTEKAQISAEMIIVMAALLGIAIILVKKLTSSADKSAGVLENKSNKVLEDINKIGT